MLALEIFKPFAPRGANKPEHLHNWTEDSLYLLSLLLAVLVSHFLHFFEIIRKLGLLFVLAYHYLEKFRYP
jgi:hypothetical protein